MYDLFDYLTWRGDLSFLKDPLNAVDSLIFCCLSYVRFSGIVPAFPSTESIALPDAVKLFFAQPKEKQIIRTQEDEKLLHAMAESKRFGSIRLLHYADRFEPEQEKQFAAVRSG